MKVSAFDFDLPEDSIALRPARPRDSAKLLQVSKTGQFSDHIVRDLSSLLRDGDVLVLNETRVFPAALKGSRPARTHGGGGDVTVDINLLKVLPPDVGVTDRDWLAFARPAKRLRIGDELNFGMLKAEVLSKDAGKVALRFDRGGRELTNAFEAVGTPPLPPYIGRKREPDMQDQDDYQTVYANAERSGSVAAPTAGLHFTPKLLKALKLCGVQIERLTLHVGAGTFLPMTSEDTDEHVMHSESYIIEQGVAERLNSALKEGRRIIAVGTTSLRALEGARKENGALIAQSLDTDIFITPGYKFQIVDGLMTNFHLPKSTLFMLVSALSGLETMQSAYAYAIENDYRFYSYGDSSLLWAAKT